jgi:hypothetical protein
VVNQFIPLPCSLDSSEQRKINFGNDKRQTFSSAIFLKKINLCCLIRLHAIQKSYKVEGRELNSFLEIAFPFRHETCIGKKYHE